MLGPWLDSWTPRILKILGLAGVALSLVQVAAGGEFQPILFGGSLGAASGGSLITAAQASKGLAEAVRDEGPT